MRPKYMMVDLFMKNGCYMLIIGAKQQSTLYSNESINLCFYNEFVLNVLADTSGNGTTFYYLIITYLKKATHLISHNRSIALYVIKDAYSFSQNMV